MDVHSGWTACQYENVFAWLISRELQRMPEYSGLSEAELREKAFNVFRFGSPEVTAEAV